MNPRPTMVGKPPMNSIGKLRTTPRGANSWKEQTRINNIRIQTRNALMRTRAIPTTMKRRSDEQKWFIQSSSKAQKIGAATEKLLSLTVILYYCVECGFWQKLTTFHENPCLSLQHRRAPRRVATAVVLPAAMDSEDEEERG